MGVEILTKEDFEVALAKIQIEFDLIKKGQQEIFKEMSAGKGAINAIFPGYISAQAYMAAVGIKRWKFDQLISGNKIKTIKKKRKIYVPIGEVERFFKDPNIQ